VERYFAFAGLFLLTSGVRRVREEGMGVLGTSKLLPPNGVEQQSRRVHWRDSKQTSKRERERERERERLGIFSGTARVLSLLSLALRRTLLGIRVASAYELSLLLYAHLTAAAGAELILGVEHVEHLGFLLVVSIVLHQLVLGEDQARVRLVRSAWRRFRQRELFVHESTLGFARSN